MEAGARGSSAERGLLPESLEERVALVRSRIADAAARAGRRASEVLLVAVTKTAEPAQVRAMIDLGHRDFGENRAQHMVQHAAMAEEYLARQRLVPSAHRAAGGAAELRWHMIGHLQRNKARKVMEVTRLIHSVDSLRLAEEIQQLALKRDHVVDVLVQVNCSGERSKFGCPVPAAIPLAEQIETMVNVRVRGLMTMAPLAGGAADARRTFVRCRELFEELRRTGISGGQVNLLSMGMSGDYEIAIEEGATIVRVGSAIFGERPDAPEGPDTPDDD